ncbi:MAG: HAMP domain-containing sensor histidine kinase [Bacteroidia bacterium]|nr:HAMP domain-containing sensor histidine kinase [Bacteroidia bacterium]
MVQNYRIHIIIGLMTLALFGIVGLQVFQIRKAIRISEDSFQVSVNDALNRLVDILYSEEIKTNFIRVSRAMEVGYADPLKDSLQTQIPEPQVLQTIKGDADYLSAPKPRRVRIRDSVAIVTEQETFVTGGDSAFLRDGEQSYTFYADGKNGSIKDLKLEMSGPRKVVELMSQTLDGLNTFHLNIAERIDSMQLDTILRQTLQDEGIYQNFKFQVGGTAAEAGFLFRQNDIPTEEFLQSRHKILLFPYSRIGEQNFLYVIFPNRGIYALRSVWFQMMASLLFSGIMLFSFALTLRTIFRQKKLSEMKNDFINNMTHELKTPIATISLAADSLNNPAVRNNNSMADRYIAIIKEENQRMNRQVERVLQAARFDRGEIHLKPETMDIHEVILQAVNNIRLQVQNREGKIYTNLLAQNYLITADKVHIANVIYNLLDNAAKYSPDSPMITVTTKNQGNRLLIRVKDKGKGIAKADQQRIFERFYRVSTGDLHEVKGFGLGLSYVKEIVEAHDGNVSVESALGKGSTFQVILPLSTDSFDKKS